jgi:hypothetical protein
MIISRWVSEILLIKNWLSLVYGTASLEHFSLEPGRPFTRPKRKAKSSPYAVRRKHDSVCMISSGELFGMGYYSLIQHIWKPKCARPALVCSEND